MKQDLGYYFRTLRPILDVHGQWLYSLNPKTASRSMIRNVLDYRVITWERGFRNWRRVWFELYENNLEKVFKFTFVRNPWDRVVSAFFYCCSRNKIPKRTDFKEYIKTKLRTVLSDRRTYPYEYFHFRNQHRAFMFDNKLIPGFFVGRFENLNKDWAYVASKIGESPVLPKVNSSNHIHYKTYYDDECIEIVADLYRKDIDILGYKF